MCPRKPFWSFFSFFHRRNVFTKLFSEFFGNKQLQFLRPLCRNFQCLTIIYFRQGNWIFTTLLIKILEDSQFMKMCTHIISFHEHFCVFSVSYQFSGLKSWLFSGWIFLRQKTLEVQDRIKYTFERRIYFTKSIPTV